MAFLSCLWIGCSTRGLCVCSDRHPQTAFMCCWNLFANILFRVFHQYSYVRLVCGFVFSSLLGLTIIVRMGVSSGGALCCSTEWVRRTRRVGTSRAGWGKVWVLTGRPWRLLATPASPYILKNLWSPGVAILPFLFQYSSLCQFVFHFKISHLVSQKIEFFSLLYFFCFCFRNSLRSEAHLPNTLKTDILLPVFNYPYKNS